MKIIYKEPAKGKTTDLIKMAADEFLYIVCMHQQEAHRIAEEARQMDLDIPFPITFYEFLNKVYYPSGIKGFLIDNVEMLLTQLTPVEIKAITLTKPPQPNNQSHD